jgi:hypothetical protein
MDGMPTPPPPVGGGETPTDPIAGGPNDDPLPGDPNALSAGQNGDNPNTGNQHLDSVIAGKDDKFKEDLANFGEKGLASDTNQSSNQQPPMPTESRFNFKHIIDEVFGDIQSQNPTDRYTTRLEKPIEDGAETESRSPFKPR